MTTLYTEIAELENKKQRCHGKFRRKEYRTEEKQPTIIG